MVIKHKRFFSGAATVEVAIVFPLLLLVTMGAIHYGWLFLKTQQLTNAARMGARVAIRPDATISDVGGITGVTTIINSLLTQSDIKPTDCTITYTPEDIKADLGKMVTVRITVPVAKVNIIPMPFMEPETWDLTAEVTMAKEGH